MGDFLVKCKNCGHPYQSSDLKDAAIEIAETSNCPKCQMRQFDVIKRVREVDVESPGESEWVRRRIERVIDRFHDHDATLLTDSVSEWSVSHKLAEYLQDEFPRWTVDCEYNIHLQDDKEDPREDADGNVRPDIIIHERGTDDRNLVIIELKKPERGNDEIRDDKDGLAAFAHSDRGYQYDFGYFILIDGSLHLERIRSQ